MTSPALVELTDSDIDWGLPAAPETPAPVDTVDLLVDALIDAQAYRELASLAIHHAHWVQVELTRLRAQHARLIQDYRELRTSQCEAAA